MRPLIIASTYNERDNIESLVREILIQAPQANVLVVDDNSPDGTGQLVRELMTKESRLHLLARPGKLGLGTAILDGMRWGLERGYDPICTMDADFSHHPKYLPAILEGSKKYDVMIGSRYIPGGGTRNWGIHRKILSKGSNLVSWILLGFPVHDCTGCYRAYRADLLRKIDRDSIKSSGYSFVEEVLELCYRAGATMGETPIIFEDRRAGQSKISKKEIFRAVGTLFRLRWQRIRLGIRPGRRS
ncbi:MAG: polyprenol monophosphomannose synthase [Planctomycetes bacterium]|nr:polyprenol monophosphomannose synthase [Planctomycetota bacterium]